MTWRIVGVAVAIAVALAAWLALRGGDDPDLKQELAELSRDFRGRVDPLPQVKPVEPAAYRTGNLPDPFYPAEKKSAD